MLARTACTSRLQHLMILKSVWIFLEIESGGLNVRIVLVEQDGLSRKVRLHQSANGFHVLIILDGLCSTAIAHGQGYLILGI